MEEKQTEVALALPLRAAERGNIVDANGNGIACAYRGSAGEQAARAELIARALNAYDDLVAIANERLVSLLREKADGAYGHVIDGEIADVRAALSKAGAAP